MIIEICSQNRALEEVANMRTGEPVSIISIVSSDEKDVDNFCFKSCQKNRPLVNLFIECYDL